MREGKRKTKGSNSRYSTIQSSNILKSVCQYCFRIFAFILVMIASDFFFVLLSNLGIKDYKNLLSLLMLCNSLDHIDMGPSF